MKQVKLFSILMSSALIITLNVKAQMCAVSEPYSSSQAQLTGKVTISKDTVVNLMKSVINSFGIKTDGTDTIKVAVEVDATLAGRFKDSAACFLFITKLYHSVDSIYFKEIKVHISICHFDIVKSSNIYGETGPNLAQICTNFQSAWNTKYSKISRTVAQFLTWSQFGGGGYGILNSLGKGSVNANAYSIAGITAAADTSWDPFTKKNVSSFTYDIYIVAHEISHNCGSHHTASCFYAGFPLDTCYGPSDACLPNDTGSRYNYQGFKFYYNKGTILSYCVQPGPQGPNLSFILPGDVTAGVNTQDHSFPLFSIYPNPANDNIRIEGPGTFAVSIHDITGRNVYSGMFKNNAYINTSGYAIGTYIVSVNDGNSKTIEKLMIIR